MIDLKPKYLNVLTKTFSVKPVLCDIYTLPEAIAGLKPYNISIGAIGPAGDW
jgi:hypothetical protein